MKKLVYIVTVALTCTLVLMLPSAAFGASEEYTYGSLVYTIDNGSITIIRCNDKNAEVIKIPSSIGGHPVNTIADNAFASNTNLQTVKVPDTVTSIGTGAIPSGVTVEENAATDPTAPVDNSSSSSSSSSTSGNSSGASTSEEVSVVADNGQVLYGGAAVVNSDEAEFDSNGVAISGTTSSSTATASSGTSSSGDATSSFGVTVPLVACVALAAVGAVVVFMRRVR